MASTFYLPYQIPELLEPGFVWSQKVKSLSMAFGLYRQGHWNLNRQQVLIGLARKSGSLAYGMKMRIAQTNMTEYGTKHNLLFDIGAVSKIIQDMQFAMQVSNVSRARLDDSEFEYLPSFILVGLKYRLSENAACYIDCRQDYTDGFTFHSGLELSLIKGIHLRCGISSNPLKPHFGFGLAFNKWKVDAAYQTDLNLGSSQSLGVSYVWN